MLNHLKNDSLLSINNIFPFIKYYRDSVFVIKYGGSVMQDEFLQKQIIQDVSFLHSIGIKVVLVHGGGPFINGWLKKFNIQPKFEDGIRVTDNKTMEIVEMVLVGKINKQLVSLFSQNNVLSIGLCGKDSNLILSSSLYNSVDNLVGKVESINTDILTLLLDNSFIPVVASVGKGLDNQTYNINADTVAGCIAKALNADKLILLTDTPGILLDINDSSSLVKKLTVDYVNQLCKDLVIVGGMIPKVKCCVEALKSNVKSTHIIDGRIQHSLLYELLTENRSGSMIIL